MTFLESVCEVISFASLEKNQADQWTFITDRLELEWSVYRCNHVRNSSYKVPRYCDELLTLKTEKFVGEGSEKKDEEEETQTSRERAAEFT
jgi:hypothetical protein